MAEMRALSHSPQRLEDHPRTLATMVEPQVSRFWHAAMQSGLIDAPALQECWESIPEDKRTHEAIDRRLARQAVELGKLTLWQAQQILAGRSNGFKIDKYILLNRIGQGGMGRVYLALDSRLNRQVALKILAPERMNNPRSIARFQREAKLGAQLQHENLVRIYDEGDCTGIRYLVMEFIEGKTVGQMINEQVQLPPAVAVEITRQVALGLEHACQKGLIHRDVNPWNILITAEGTAKLTDLGLAIDPTDQQDNVTRDGATVGTFDYIAPEQARHSRSVDTRADIYALGCTLYHMLAGRVPFPTPSLPEKLYAHQLSEPEPLTAVVPHLPVGLDDVVRRMMKKNPADRYERPIEVARALEIYLNGSPLTQATTSSQWTAPPLAEPVAEVGSRQAAAPMGSDWELAQGGRVADGAGQATPRTPAPDQKSGSGSIFPELDLGPEPSLLDPRSPGVKSRSTTMTLGPRPLQIGLGVVVAVIVVLAVVITLIRGLGLPPQAESGELKKTAAGVFPIEVEGGGDGVAQAVWTLNEAVQRAGGRPGAILIGQDDGPLVVKGGVNFAQGRYSLLARPLGAPRALLFDLSDPSTGPAVRVRASSSLTMEGLTLIMDYGAIARRGEEAPPGLEVAGNLTLKNCHLIARGRAAGLRGIEFKGNRLELDGCVVEGFDHAALAYEASRGSDVVLRHCLFVPPRSEGRLPGWVLRVNSNPVGKADLDPPRIHIERCTILGRGALVVEGFRAERPLTIEAQGLVVRGQHLLMAASQEFPEALLWSGEHNRYQIQGAWAVLAPSGLDPLSGGAGFSEWQETFQSREQDAKRQTIVFAADKLAANRAVSPADYVPLDLGDERVGIDPARVGPEASKSGARDATQPVRKAGTAKPSKTQGDDRKPEPK